MDNIENEEVETGFRTMSMSEFRRLRFSTLTPKPKVVFINQRKLFRPPEDVLTRYHDWLRRLSDKPPHTQKAQALRGSSYDARYRQQLFKHPKSIALVRSLGEQSRKGLVLLVSTRDTPDAQIILSIIKRMGWG